MAEITRPDDSPNSSGDCADRRETLGALVGGPAEPVCLKPSASRQYRQLHSLQLERHTADEFEASGLHQYKHWTPKLLHGTPRHPIPRQVADRQSAPRRAHTGRGSLRLRAHQAAATRSIGVRNHPGKGREIYARRHIAPHEVLTQWRVQPASVRMAQHIVPHDQVIWRNGQQRGSPQVPMRDLDYHPNKTWYKFNHSPSPNCRVQAVQDCLQVITTRYILAGEACEWNYGEPDPSWS